jgi:thymidylate kinase
MSSAAASPPLCIVLEGLDGVGKSTAAAGLARRLGARLLHTPPSELSSFRAYFDAAAEPGMKRGYYMVGNFLAAEAMAKAAREGAHVVCDRFFASTRAYALAKEAPLPAAGDAAYAWPPELLRPHYMLQLVLPEAQRLARRAARTGTPETGEEAQLRTDTDFALRVRDAYGRMGCTEVSAEGTEDDVVDRLLAAIGR